MENKDKLEAAVERLEGGSLVERLRWEPGDCPFCGRDPYHYVDNGVGMERVAVTCCDEGIALFQHGDPVLSAQVALRVEAAGEIERLEAALSASKARALAAEEDAACWRALMAHGLTEDGRKLFEDFARTTLATMRDQNDD